MQAQQPVPLRLLDRLAATLVDATDLESIWQALGAAASEVCGATAWAVLRLDTDGRCRREAHTDSGLPEVITGEAWRLAGTTPDHPIVSWPSTQKRPTALAGYRGWASGLAVTVHGSSVRRLLVLGSPTGTGAGRGTDLAAMAGVVGPAVRAIELQRSAARARALLKRVTDLATRLASADDPGGLLHALVEGVAAIDVVEVAAVWGRGEDGRPTVEQGSHMMLAEEVDQAAIARISGVLDPSTEPVRLSRLTRAGVLPSGRLLTLLPVGKQPRRVLGLIHARPLDDDESGVFSTLVGAIGPALRQAEMAVERSTLVATFGRVLRPHIVPAGVDIGVEHHANTSAAETFGGDFYDWFVPAANRVLLALGDVSGKGIPAAAASSMAVWSLRAFGRQGTGPSLIARLMDTAVAEELGDDRFVTLALLDAQIDTWQARLVLAGHPAPIMVPEPVLEADITPDRPLGVMPDGPAFTVLELSLSPGQTVVLFTDGVTDGCDSAGERLGRSRLVEMVSEAVVQGSDAQDVATRLWSSVRGWVGGTPDDDCAILVFRRPPDR